MKFVEQKTIGGINQEVLVDVYEGEFIFGSTNRKVQFLIGENVLIVFVIGEYKTISAQYANGRWIVKPDYKRNQRLPKNDFEKQIDKYYEQIKVNKC